MNIPVFEEAVFAKPSYSLFGTPAWVDRALLDLRELNRQKAELAVLQKQYDLLNEELTRIIQRVNLFEKIKIPEARDAIRVIRIKLGDEMTAAVGRANPSPPQSRRVELARMARTAALRRAAVRAWTRWPGAVPC